MKELEKVYAYTQRINWAPSTCITDKCWCFQHTPPATKSHTSTSMKQLFFPWNNCFSVLLSFPSDDTVIPQEKMMADNEQLTNESLQNSAVQSQHPSQELLLNRSPSSTPEEVILLMDSNGKCIDSKKFCPTKSVKHIFSHCKFYDRNPKQPVLWFAISYCLLHWYKW